jgi:hypothetical protein
MIYRAGILGVVLFWGAMWALLIRSELRPQEWAWRAVPIDLVLKQLFVQGQTSDLHLIVNGARDGHLRLVPKTDERTGERQLSFTGDIRVAASGSAPARAFWEGAVVLDDQLGIREIRGSLVMRAPGAEAAPPTRAELLLQPPVARGLYRLAVSGEPPFEQNFTLDEAGVRAVAAGWGVSDDLLAGFAARGAKMAPEISARQERLKIQGEEVETYVVTIRSQGQTWLEMHVSQLGQILQAKTLLGWELRTE